MKKKSIVTEILIVIFIGVVGGVIAFLVDRIDFSAALGSIYGILGIAVPILFVLVNVISLIISEMRFRKAKNRYEKYDEKNEDELTEIENSLNFPIMLLTVAAIINLLFISAIIELTDYTNVYSGYTAVVVIGTIAVTVISVILQFVILRKYIELVKEINPEKKGDILDKHFDKNWEENCDEGEKLIMYKSAYKAMKTTNICCAVLWLVCLFLQICFGTGVLPVVCISAIWLTMTISYCIENNKNSK